MVLRRVVLSPVTGCANERVNLIVSLAVFVGGAAPLVARLEQVSFSSDTRSLSLSSVSRLPSSFVGIGEVRLDTLYPLAEGGCLEHPLFFLARRPAGTVVISPWRHDL